MLPHRRQDLIHNRRNGMAIGGIGPNSRSAIAVTGYIFDE